jgi:hypothetical protein
MDMLIKLYPPDAHAAGGPAGVVLRTPIGPEHDALVRWVLERFGPGWASEARVALANRPVTAWIAVRGRELLGFACFDATALGFIGPLGVADAERGRGTGAALLRAALRDMRSSGYGYAVAGAVGPADFFVRAAGATEIAGSSSGLYDGRLAP